MSEHERGRCEEVSLVGVGPLGVISLWRGWHAGSGFRRNGGGDPIFGIAGGQPILDSQRPAGRCCRRATVRGWHEGGSGGCSPCNPPGRVSTCGRSGVRTSGQK